MFVVFAITFINACSMFRIPTAMKQCGDTRWGDWRPHLAMILSNTVNTDINRRSDCCYVIIMLCAG